ncbi:Rha family transcriptional regulator [Aeromonas media]|uniref:Rha family transcriptional regulator n=1 Tax=Aeromonas media TaxID=651 RepID=A0AAW5RRL8_AERME|nr:Rha family transcriptional regulator [Aeromonas media]MCV3289525.1 Rha family transcriptional regulator [Aeromonas media]
MNTQVAQYNAMPSFLVNSKPLTMSSLQIAEVCKKEHRNVLAFIRQAIDDLGKVRTSIPRTKNENFSHLISMGYQ